jgi:hypothetical protein
MNLSVISPTCRANILESPNSITTIYSYSPTSGYQPATLIVSGAAHWIKARQTCQITIQAGSTMNVGRQFLTDASLFDNDELPPPPPGGEGAAAVQEPLPEVFALHQNYPNPFNSAPACPTFLSAQCGTSPCTTSWVRSGPAGRAGRSRHPQVHLGCLGWGSRTTRQRHLYRRLSCRLESGAELRVVKML